MRRAITIFTITIMTLLSLQVVALRPVSAVEVIDKICNTPTATGQAPEVCVDDSTNNSDAENPVLGANGVVARGVRLFIIIFGITALFVMMINAVRMITSQGDSNSVNSARNGLIYAAIALTIAVTSQFIISLIISKFGT